VSQELLPGAEAWSSGGGPGVVGGALCLHGFGGNPSVMRPVGVAFASAGFAVEVPRLPGHGTTVEDMAGTGWDDWAAEAASALVRLAARCQRVVVVGQSMGGSLALWLGARHPELAGIASINAGVRPQPDEVVAMVREMVAAGEDVVPAGPSDIADPDVVEVAYDATPLRPWLTLMDALLGLERELARISVPVLVAVSPNDHTVDPSDGEILARTVRGPVEQVVLQRSFHVATLDYDGPWLCERLVEFGRRVTTLGDFATS
jgi:carboxylesterase